MVKKLCLEPPSTMTTSQIFFSNSFIWRFSRFILTCDMKLDLSEHFSEQKVVPGVPFDYDDFAYFFRNSCNWRFSGFSLTCDMKLDLSAHFSGKKVALGEPFKNDNF